MPKCIKMDRFRYISSEAWRALTAIEMGLKNHEVVPPELALKISHLRRSCIGFSHLVQEQLILNKLVAYETDNRHSMKGYRLTNLGYDYLALNQLFKSEQLASLGTMIGAGKESDVYIATAGARCGRLSDDSEDLLDEFPKEGDAVVVKFHRLGRTSFRKVKEKREYHQHRSSCSWLYLDRLASRREFVMMQSLRSKGIPVPIPYTHNRNAVVMSYVADSLPLYRILPSILNSNESALARSLYYQAKDILERVASLGLVHGDLNEFNLMVSDLDPEQNMDISNPKLVLIDFPQMISRDHKLANTIYERDAEGVVNFFSRYFDIPLDDLPSSLDSIKRIDDVDLHLKAPGYISKNATNRHSQHTTEDSLLGPVARLQLSSSENSEVEESTCDSDSDSVDSTTTNSQENDQSQIESDGKSDSEEINHNKNNKKDITSVQGTEIKTKPTLITVEEIRERNRRERRRQKQVDFNRQIKRHNRAAIKRQGRLNMKTEALLFG
ncbi:putative serine/threonine-protein kinase rio2 (rio kinase 2) [Schistosoma mansoni]|uniref:non-specific serine/threonine protein kinase n=2 Tax=Schistosoma mansoni TaxID=6183 RepID=A0A3Q0KF34_SCHMA|nr:putative serine/threonine-protein kinase rio2 (rio kinase 2) [Schistosoma mansoni]|eukprot:XP_018651982.1 putative serine/threonine-protein kinase rio2 (rio kinase 2) [Schistosoma mansoni]